MVNKPDPKVPLALTEAERKLILDDLMYIEDEYTSVVRATPTDQPVRFTMNDWVGVAGCIATTASHARDKRLKKELDRIHARIRTLLEDDKTPTALKIYRGGDEQVSEDAVKLPRKDTSDDEG